MAERIYVTDGEHGLEPLTEEPFPTEDELQALLAEHPELLDGEQMRPGDPRRWILITREQRIADTGGTTMRWSLDHLIVDQDATPTLVEVKRGENSEVRRTVVGQMLDYAAHAPQVWTVDELRQTFEEQPDADERLADLLQRGEPDADAFWEDVARNLAAKRLRLLFVADAIPDELAQVVEFLNEQMSSIEVLAVEIKQFRGKTMQTLVPRVIGRLAKSAAGSPSSGPRRTLTRRVLLEEIGDAGECAAATRLLDLAAECSAHLKWGAASVGIRAVDADGGHHTVALIYRPNVSWVGQMEFSFGARSVGGMKAGDLRDFLERWTLQFESDSFTTLATTNMSPVWVVKYDDAVKNIDLLADRLRSALTEIRTLSTRD